MVDIDFCELALEHNVVLLPGRAFSNLNSHVRLSYGAPTKDLKAGLQILPQLVKIANNKKLSVK